ncbi:hypothetical protein BpHYR1_016848 [Brachionus plicatilis]|uniref:Zinc finger PHD-type domain-containing protein n=1 Tax=Brachionus plicatilis TaxID=10195 RepID=A0A3M7P4L5_BRAPC|nr:hypothetical protein BpHYR1_016848 [Brachionus plicatilis]
MKVYSVELKRLTYEQVVEIFTEFQSSDQNHSERIEFPKSGDVIIFWSSESSKHNDWTTDGFKWKNQGTRKALIPTSPNDPAVFKNYYQMIDRNKCINKEVIKDVYFFKDQAMPIIVHYLDKKTKANSLLEYDSGPHGNVKSKENAENYQRTLPSVLSQIKENVSKRAPHLVYKETSKKKGVRDLKQCQNLRYVNEILSSNTLIKAKWIISNFNLLTDIFLDEIDMEGLEKFFNISTWKIAKSLIDQKVKHCFCPVCSNVCLENSIECENCRFWYHFDCAKVSKYHRAGKGKSWICEKYGFVCERN